MYIETWYKIHCPECKTSNWLCDGDTSDCTTTSVEACKCYKCSHCFLLDDESYDEDDLDTEAIKECAELGLEKPR